MHVASIGFGSPRHGTSSMVPTSHLMDILSMQSAQKPNIASAGDLTQAYRAPQAPAPLPSRSRVLLHTVAIVAGWGLFAWFWVLTTQQKTDPRGLWWLISAAVLLVPTITLTWIFHNVGIHRRRGPRRGVRTVPLRYDADSLGRDVDADWRDLRSSAFVEIYVDAGGVKQYRSVASPHSKNEIGQQR